MRQRFGLKRVVFADDCGLLTSAHIDNELRPVAELDWITVLRRGQVRQLVTEGDPLQLSLFDETDLAELRHEDFPGERLIACLNPFLREELIRKREELLQATEALLDPIVAVTHYCFSTRMLWRLVRQLVLFPQRGDEKSQLLVRIRQLPLQLPDLLLRWLLARWVPLRPRCHLPPRFAPPAMQHLQRHAVF